MKNKIMFGLLVDNAAIFGVGTVIGEWRMLWIVALLMLLAYQSIDTDKWEE